MTEPTNQVPQHIQEMVRKLEEMPANQRLALNIQEIMQSLRLNSDHPDAIKQAVWELSQLADGANSFGSLLRACAADLMAALPEESPV